MEKILSRINPGLLLHFIVRRNDFIHGRQDLIEPDNFLQCSMLNLGKGKTFQPHQHIWKNRKEGRVIAQESWVVIKGWVKVFFYDTDDQLIKTAVLGAGDASYTLQGGHNYEILEDDTRVYEFKTGPYEGQEKDKVFINE